MGFPPSSGTGSGSEIGYDQITGNVNIASTTEATGTTIITCAAHVFDGTAAMCELYVPNVKVDSASVGDAVILSLFEATTQIGRIIQVTTQVTSNQFFGTWTGKIRFTPTAGSHSYTITAFATSTTGTPGIQCGAGGTGVYPPAFVRFTKA